MTATARMLDGILNAVITGLDEADLPLTAEQRAFLADSVNSLDPLAEAVA